MRPSVLQAIASGFFSTEADLLIARFVLPSTIYQVFKGDLFCVRSPCVRKDGTFRNIVVHEALGQAELASAVAL